MNPNALQQATEEALRYARLFTSFVTEENPDAASLADAARDLRQKAGRLATIAAAASRRAA